MKKLSLVLLLVVALVCLGACASEPAPAPAPAEQPAPSEGEEPVEAPVYELRCAGINPPDSPSAILIQEFIDNVKEATNGGILITYYPSSQLGDYELVYEELMRGTIDMTINSVSSKYDKTFSAPYIPCLASTFEEASSLYTEGSVLMDALYDAHENLGVKMLGVSAEGFMGIGFVKDPGPAYADPETKKEVLVRTPNDKLWISVIEACGYNTANVAYSELYSSLQTGVVDGFTGVPSYSMSTEYADIVTHMVDYNFYIEPLHNIINMELFNSMPADYQQALMDCAAELTQKSLQTYAGLEEEAYKNMEAAGITVYRLTDEERAVILATEMEKSWPVFEEELGSELMDALRASL